MAQTNGAPLLLARGAAALTDRVTSHGGWAVSAQETSAATALIDGAPLAKLVVHAPPGGAVAALLGRRLAGALRTPGGLLSAADSAGEWSVFGPAAAPAQAEIAAAASGEAFTVVDLTHGRSVYRVVGPEGPGLVQDLAALAPPAIASGRATFTRLAGIRVGLLRVDRTAAGSSPLSILLHCARRHGQHLFDMLRDAGARREVGVLGFASSDPRAAW
ncbi:MAG: hypothetical protein ACKVWR_02725 [Acidimicrobiales bacterium]